MKHPSFVLAIVVLLLAGLSACSSSHIKSSSEQQKDEAVSLYVQLGLGYLRQNQTDIAISKIERALKLNPRSVLAHTAIATAYTQSNRPKIAERHFKLALRYGPYDSSAHYNYGVFLCSRNRIDAALKHFNQALEDRSNNAPEKSNLEIGRCLLKRRDLKAAERYFLKATSLNQNMSQAHLELSSLYYEQKRLRQAQKHFARFYNIGRLSPASLWLGIQIEEKLGDRARRQQYVHVLKRKFPNSQQAGLFPDPVPLRSRVPQVEKNGADMGKTKPLNGGSKEEIMEQRMRKLRRLMKKYPAAPNAENTGTRQSTAPSSGGDDGGSTPNRARSNTGAITLDQLIEQRRRAELQRQSQSPAGSPATAPASKPTASSSSGGDFMDIME